MIDVMLWIEVKQISTLTSSFLKGGVRWVDVGWILLIKCFFFTTNNIVVLHLSTNEIAKIFPSKRIEWMNAITLIFSFLTFPLIITVTTLSIKLAKSLEYWNYSRTYDAIYCRLRSNASQTTKPIDCREYQNTSCLCEWIHEPLQITMTIKMTQY